MKIRWSAAAPQSVRALPRLRCARSCKVGREPRPSVAPVTGHFSRLFLASDFFLSSKQQQFPRDEQHAKSTLCSGPEVLAPRNASIDGKRQTSPRAREPASGEASGKASRALPSPEGGPRRDRAKPSLPATRSRDTLRRLARLRPRTLRVDGGEVVLRWEGNRYEQRGHELGRGGGEGRG